MQNCVPGAAIRINPSSGKVLGCGEFTVAVVEPGDCLSSTLSLVALRVARELRQAGVSTQAVRRVVEFLRRSRGLGNPLAESRLVVVGSDVQLVNGCEELESLLDKPGQAVFAFMLDLGRTVQEIQRDTQALRLAS